MNLLLVLKIIERGYIVRFDRHMCKIFTQDGNIVALAKLTDSLYKLVQPSNIAFSCKEDNGSLWHRRLCHLNRVSMKSLRDKYAYGLKFGDPDEYPCKICVKGKQIRQSFSTRMNTGRRISKPLELVHTDLCGPMEEASIGGSKYFILFVDDYSRKLSIYFLKNKSKALNAFKTYKAYTEKHTGYQIKALRSDNGREYLNESFKSFLRDEGVRHELTIPYTP